MFNILGLDTPASGSLRRQLALAESTSNPDYARRTKAPRCQRKHTMSEIRDSEVIEIWECEQPKVGAWYQVVQEEWEIDDDIENRCTRRIKKVRLITPPTP